MVSTIVLEPAILIVGDGTPVRKRKECFLRFANQKNTEKAIRNSESRKKLIFDYSNIISQPSSPQQIEISEKIVKLFPNINAHLLMLTIQYVEEHHNVLKSLKKVSRSRELPFAITFIEDRHYLIHLKRMNGSPAQEVKGRYKEFFESVEVLKNRVKKRAELLIRDSAGFEKDFPEFRKRFHSLHVMKPPIHEINHGNNKKSLIYPCYNCDLGAFLRTYKPSKKQKLAVLIALTIGVRDMHKEKFAHRDLKEANVLVKCDQNGELIKIKIADLDTALPEERCVIGKWVGTFGYIPISVMTKKECESLTSDMFSLGKITKKVMDLESYDEMEMKEKKLSPFQEHMRDLTEKKLGSTIDPNARITAEEWLKELQKVSLDFQSEL